MKTTRMVRRGPTLAAAVLAAACTAGAAEWHVSPAGKADGDGSQGRPWLLATALAHPAAVKPGDTIWLHGGTYAGHFESRLKGAEGRPITVRAVPGERATIDCRVPAGRRGEFDIAEPHVVFWGLEITCSDPKRATKVKGSWPADIRRGGFFCRASHVKFVNCIVHDCSCGFGFWGKPDSGFNGEIYGCLIYNNGWVGPDRGHGHAIYAQNARDTKRLVDNIMFNQFSYGVHAYGSGRAFLSGFHLEGNVSFNNGSATAPDRRTPAVLVGGGCAAERITLIDNFTYGGEQGGGTVQLGYLWGLKHNKDVVVRGNYIVGEARLLHWDKLTFEGNTVVAPSGLVQVQLPDGGGTKDYACRGNTYFRTGTKWSAFAFGPKDKPAGRRFAEWRKEGLDADSTYTEGRPTGVKVFVRPNRYEPGRAHVIVYNWDGKAAVAVDLKAVLKEGGKYRIVNAQDFYGEAVAAGTYDGKPVALPMKPTPAARPIGMPEAKLPVTQPEFGVFVVLGAD